jgi:group I intron endonuclease
MIGIYKITNPKGKIYIGQSSNIEQRFSFYKKLKCKSQHKIYNSFVKYGVDKHNFEIIHLCEIEQLNELEKYYVDLFQTFNNKNGLNIKDGGGAKGKHSDETKKKISNAAIGRKCSNETKQKLSIIRKGRIISEQTRQRMSESQKGRIITDIHRKNISIARIGIKLAKESLERTEKRKKIILNLETGIYYFGVAEAALYNNLNKRTLEGKLNGWKKNNTNLLYV